MVCKHFSYKEDIKNANLLLRQNQLNAKDMETKNLVFDAGNRRTQQIRTRS